MQKPCDLYHDGGRNGAEEKEQRRLVTAGRVEKWMRVNVPSAEASVGETCDVLAEAGTDDQTCRLEHFGHACICAYTQQIAALRSIMTVEIT